MDRPFLRLAPFKIEILRFSPLVVLFRNVMSDEEVSMIQMLATPKVYFISISLSFYFLFLLKKHFFIN